MGSERPMLEEVFNPRGIAVVGASQSEAGATVWVQGLKEAKFPAIYPVNPKYDEVFGLPCYPNVRDIPGVVDHVIVVIPAEAALPLLDDCAAKGVKSVHFFTAGFSESGSAERTEIEGAMLSRARAGGFRIIGPNCVGLFVPKSHISNTSGVPVEPGPIAFLSQSGGHAQNITFFGSPRGLRFSKVVSYGNALDVDESELLHYFSQDPETEIIAAYIEGVKDGKRFISALREAASRKPVIVYKGGITEAGKRTAHGHTASLTSSVIAFNALCRQMKAIQVDDMDEMLDTMVALRFINPLPQGNGIAVVGAGGGPSVLAGDEMEKAGLQLPLLPKEVEAELRKSLPLAGSIIGNPVDAPNLVYPEIISVTMRVLSKVSDIDLLMYHLGFHPISRWGGGRLSRDVQPVVDCLSEVRQAHGKPILLTLRPPPNMLGMEHFLDTQEAFVRAGFPVFHSMRQAAKAIARLVAWNQP